MPDIQYYVVRQSIGPLLQQQDGPGRPSERLVPMVPVDQLPDWLEIVGVPREMQAEHAAKMTALLDLGRRGGPHGVFQVRLLTDSTGEATDEDCEHSKEAVHAQAAAGTSTPPASDSVSEPVSESVSASPAASVTDATETDDETRVLPDKRQKETTTPDEDPGCWKLADAAACPAKSLAMSAPPGHQSDKSAVLPCKYWCTFGRCGFKRCRFAHVMPLTREGLRTVDLDELPPWYTRRQSSTRADANASQSSENATRTDSGSKPKTPAGSPRKAPSSGGSPTTRSKLHKIQKMTAATASYTSSKYGSGRSMADTRASGSPCKPAAPVAKPRAVEVDDLIDLS